MDRIKKRMSDSKEASMLVLVYRATSPKLNPASARSYLDYMVTHSVYQTLFRRNDQGNFTGGLVETWKVFEEGKIYQLRLKPEAKFSDGSEVLAIDVIESLSMHGWPEINSIVDQYLKDIVLGYSDIKESGQIPSGLVALDEKTVQIELSHPSPHLLNILSMPGFAIQKSGILKRNQSLDGSGEFYVRWNESSNVLTMKRRQEAKKSKHLPTEIEVRWTIDLSEIKETLKSRMVHLVLGLSPEKVEELEIENQILKDYTVLKSESFSINAFVLNERTNALRENPKMRTDLGLLIQAATAHCTKELSYQTPRSSLLPEGLLPEFYYDRKVEEISADLFASRWGHLFGERDFNILIDDNFWDPSWCRSFKAKIESVLPTIKVHIGRATEFQKTWEAGEIDLFPFGYIGNFPDPYGFIYGLKSDLIPHFKISSDDLMTRAVLANQIRDPKRRLIKYAKIIQEFEDSGWIIPMFKSFVPMILHKIVRLSMGDMKYEDRLCQLFKLIEIKEPGEA